MGNEIIPVLSGVVVGALIGLIRPDSRLLFGAICAIVAGTGATIVTGEWRLGWEYLLIDIPLVAACAAAVHVTIRLLRRRLAESNG